MRQLIALWVALVCCAAPLRATPRHDDLEHRIQQLTQELQASPGREDLLLQRAELYRRHAQWDEALTDLAHLPNSRDSREFVLVNARLHRDLGFPNAARVDLDRYLLREPQDAPVRLLRSQVLELGGHFLAALLDLDRLIAALEFPEPDLFLARSRVASACPELAQAAIPRALAGLDEGSCRLGLLPSLQIAAIDLELLRGFHDAALQRLETLAQQSPRKESWLSRRGDIQLAAGREQQARDSYRAALGAIDRLNSHKRRAQAMETLEVHVRAQLLLIKP